MLIIIEGIDGAGKTTLADLLEKQLRELAPKDTVTRLHKGPPTTTALEEYELPLQDYRPGDRKHIVIDRWHIGELVYGPVLRDQSIVRYADELHIDKFLAARGTMLVHPVIDLATAEERMAGREQLIEADMLEELQGRYWDVFCHQKTQTWQSFWGSEEMDAAELVTALILSEARDLEMKAVGLSGFPSYVGPPSPDLLLLGERKNPNGDERWMAAFTPGDATSGRYLLEHLPESVARSCGLANAMEENVEALVRTLGNPAVVTLGNVAHEAASAAGVDHGSVAHPQYIRRFHHRYGEEYGRLIRRAGFLREDLRAWRP